MKVAFMGTPGFALPTLRKLLDSRHQICCVVTAPDKPAGRSLKLTSPPVKELALAEGLPLLQPEDLRDASFLDTFKAFQPDVGVVVAFRILPPELFTIHPRGCVNLHASLLPELRGAAPINWALMRGYKQTGLTTFVIRESVDTGGILLQEALEVDPDDDVESLSERMMQLGAELVLKTLDGLESDSLTPRLQEGIPTRAPKITPQVQLIDWNRAAVDIHNQVRGLSPAPGAITSLEGKRLKILKTRSVLVGQDSVPAVVVGQDTVPANVVGQDTVPANMVGQVSLPAEGCLRVATSRGALDILELQLEGKRRMSVAEFLRGYRITGGTKLV